MGKFHNILICLPYQNFENFDFSLIRQLAALIKPENTFFFMEISEDQASLIESQKDIIQKEIEGIFPGYKIGLEFDNLNNLLKYAKKQDTDLILLFQKNSVSGKEEFLKIVKNSICSVIYFPEGATAGNIKKIMLPVDFSELSSKALRVIIDLFKEQPKAEYILSHIYSVPADYHASGKSYEETAQNELKTSRNEYQNFLKEVKLSAEELKCIFLLDDEKDPADKIYNEALSNGYDLIVVNAKGKTNSPSLLSGSVSFSLCICSEKIPLMIIKDKKENFDIAEILLKV